MEYGQRGCKMPIQQFVNFHLIANYVMHGIHIAYIDIDFSDGSCCPECGSIPEIVVCDATTVSFRRKMLIQKNVDENTEMIAGGR